MMIRNTRFGDIQVEEDKLLTFPGGIPGFEHANRFTLLRDEAMEPFFWLQSLDEPEVAVIVVDPFLFFPDYAPLLIEEYLEILGLEDPGDVTLFVITTIPEDACQITANLAAPIAIHNEHRIGVQAILDRGAYEARTPMYQQVLAYWKGGAEDAGSDA
jgi:flagellar assembly factor FliW